MAHIDLEDFKAQLFSLKEHYFNQQECYKENKINNAHLEIQVQLSRVENEQLIKERSKLHNVILARSDQSSN